MQTPSIAILFLALLGCDGSDEPTENYGAATATDGLEQLERGDMSCACTYNNQQRSVFLTCLDSDVVGDPASQTTTFSFLVSPWQNTRHWSYVDWQFSVVGTAMTTADNWGMVEASVGESITDRRGGDEANVWVPLFIHKMRVEPHDSCGLACAAGQGGYLAEGTYWCHDVNTNPWDVNPDWRSVHQRKGRPPQVSTAGISDGAL